MIIQFAIWAKQYQTLWKNTKELSNFSLKSIDSYIQAKYI